MTVVRDLVGRFPRVYCAVARARAGRNRRVVDGTTDLVLEAFPRSGNTFALAWIRLACPDLKVASHVHHPAHVRRAIQLTVPALVIVREPCDAVVSQMIYADISDENAVLDRWIDFYSVPEMFHPLVHREPFDAVRGDMSGVFDRLSRRTGLLAEQIDQAPTDEVVFALVEELGRRRFGVVPVEKAALPTPARVERQAELRRELESGATRSKVQAARSLYRRLTDR